MRLLLLVIVLAGCQIDGRSQSFRCEVAEDCEDGRSCVEGWCVLGEDPIDAPGGDDAFECPVACTRCEGGACVIECNGNGSCPGRMICPPGMPCRVTCGGMDSCAAGVDCSMASACEITCGNRRACGGEITCGPGECTVTCSGRDACHGAIDCAASCKCDVLCTGQNVCTGDEVCPSVDCSAGQGCTSTVAGCDACQ